MRAAKVQASLRIRAVSPEPSLLAHTSSESRGTFRQKARSLAPLNGWACAVKVCHNGMLEDTNSLDGAQFIFPSKFPVRRLSTCNSLNSEGIVQSVHKSFCVTINFQSVICYNLYFILLYSYILVDKMLSPNAYTVYMYKVYNASI